MGIACRTTKVLIFLIVFIFQKMYMRWLYTYLQLKKGGMYERNQSILIWCGGWVIF